MRLKLKGCTHCGGDLVPDVYENDGTKVCLQCGRAVYPAYPHGIRRQLQALGAA